MRTATVRRESPSNLTNRTPRTGSDSSFPSSVSSVSCFCGRTHVQGLEGRKRARSIRGSRFMHSTNKNPLPRKFLFSSARGFPPSHRPSPSGGRYGQLGATASGGRGSAPGPCQEDDPPGPPFCCRVWDGGAIFSQNKDLDRSDLCRSRSSISNFAVQETELRIQAVVRRRIRLLSAAAIGSKLSLAAVGCKLSLVSLRKGLVRGVCAGRRRRGVGPPGR